ncbi:Fructosamine kinase-domain-containing protein [Achaetomium macrosporum]|uniref:protein-ribulosamine 3-kinase n=1 Tax=Achaetomium macrosporum TaxID=79813 RepID=A0AAN7C211_9PEZI|nr:Fructosamine kinase-domain-containing protein [Achaetomium macrosporum]
MANSTSGADGTGGLPVDPNIVAVLPCVERIVGVRTVHQSPWAKALRLDVHQTDGSDQSYFIKISFGHHGRDALKGEFEATAAISAITPDFCPKPAAWGSLGDEPDGYFYVCKFYDFADGVMPDPISFCEKLARLHSSHTSPEGKFGFHCTTHNGDLPQDNTWSDCWEGFFSNGLRHVLQLREERAGPNAELDAWLPALFDKIIPRLLRPMESNGRKIEPSLVHGDLWYGNSAVIKATGEGIVFDPASFWAHNEYELGNWLPERNRFGNPYFKAYHSHIDPTKPEDDYDDRIRLYALRFNLHAATLFPDEESYLRLVIDEIRALAKKYPNGYVEGTKPDVAEQNIPGA